MDLTKAEDNKKRWQEYKELYKKDLHDLDNHDGMITRLEPDILEREVKWVLGSITTNKSSGGDGIVAELFQILKDDVVQVLHSLTCQRIWKTQQWPQDWKRSVLIPIPKKGNTKECSNYHKIALIPHATKLMLKILQGRLQQCVSRELHMFKLDLEKAEEPEIKLPNLLDHWRNKRVPEKHLLYCPCQSLWLCGSHQTVENSSRDGNTRPPDLPSEKSVCRSRSNS